MEEADGVYAGKPTGGIGEMTDQNKALAYSLAIHLIVIILALGVMKATPTQKKTIVIDFSLSDRPAAKQPAQTAGKTESTAEVKQPAPARPVKQRVAPVKKAVVMQAAPEPRQTTLTDNRDTPVTPQPAASAEPEPSAGAPGNPDGDTRAAVTESPETIYVKAHFAAIRSAITSKLSYPPTARKMGWTGTVKVSFMVNEDGGVSNVRVIETSGHDVLDNSAVETIRRGSPYPKPPCKAEIIMPIKFRLDD
ncbi:MAG: energy transducer TonB [Nitrospirae bacterium]|nr:energy transducer TonB [Nitrospirota bacterium]